MRTSSGPRSGPNIFFLADRNLLGELWEGLNIHLTKEKSPTWSLSLLPTAHHTHISITCMVLHLLSLSS